MGAIRIRSTKPEFWRSKTISSVSWDARLVLKALESYVDDNGVGKDDMELIVMQTFSRDQFRNPTGTVRRVSEAVSELIQAHLVTRYEADGEPLLYVERWKDHQYVQKPQKGRFPRPDGTLEYSETVDSEAYRKGPEEYGNSPARIRGSEEQGSGEQVKPPAAVADGQSETGDRFELAHPDPPRPPETELFDRFWDAYPRKDDKGKAREKFKAALNRADAEQIIAGAERYRDDPNRDPAYTKLATTWLNADAWDNGPLPPRTTGRPSVSERKDAEFARAAEAWLPQSLPGEIEP
ncbi:hypothetical protein [Nesterenkonia populi]|uniref:hypothetical protein n=1 Tax=Nesterenkonia populi TaxID=1591087 RepID=UPI0011BE0F15|nr:hypothetical protein [Nesterenkonia populi]